MRAQWSLRDAEPREQGELREEEGQVVGETCLGGGWPPAKGPYQPHCSQDPNMYDHK